MQREHSREQKKKIKEASKYLGEISFVGIESVQLQDKSEICVLQKKDNTYTVVFTIAGMTLEGITEDEFERYYVRPLATLFNYAENVYQRFLEVPIDFTENIQSSSKSLQEDDNPIRKILFENALDFYEIMQEERLLQVYPLLLIDVNELRDVKDMLQFISQVMLGFNPQFFNEEQLEVFVRYLNNPGTRLPAFVAL